MRFIFFTLIMCLFIAPSTNAQEARNGYLLKGGQAPTAPADEKGSTASTKSKALTRTAVVADEEAGVIRFFIDGKEMGRFDAQGLHVRDDLVYGSELSQMPYTDQADSGGNEAP